MNRPGAALITVILLAGCAEQQASSASQATPTPDGTASNAASASAGPAGATALEDVEPGTSLAPGTYVLNYASIGGSDRFPTLAVTFSVPDGWERVRVDGLLWHDAGVRLLFAVVDNLYVDPCDPGRGVWEPPIGPSVDDLTTGLLSTSGWENAVVTEDAFYGFGGQQVQLTADTECPGEDAKLFHTLGSPGYALPPGTGDEYDLRILNVGGTRFVIIAWSGADAPATARESLRSVLDSIQIQP